MGYGDQILSQNGIYLFNVALSREIESRYIYWIRRWNVWQVAGLKHDLSDYHGIVL